MNHKKFFLLGGYTKWSRKLKKKFYNFGLKSSAYSKFKENNSELKKINYRNINSFRFVVLASDYKSNNTFLINLLKRNYSKFIFIEKPISINKRQITLIKRLNRKILYLQIINIIMQIQLKKLLNFTRKTKINSLLISSLEKKDLLK